MTQRQKDEKKTSTISKFNIEKVITIIGFGSVLGLRIILKKLYKKDHSDEFWFDFNFDSIMLPSGEDIVYTIRNNKENEPKTSERSKKSAYERQYSQRVLQYVHQILRERKIIEDDVHIFSKVKKKEWKVVYDDIILFLREKVKQLENQDYKQIVVSLDDTFLKQKLIHFIRQQITSENNWFNIELFEQSIFP